MVSHISRKTSEIWGTLSFVAEPGTRTVSPPRKTELCVIYSLPGWNNLALCQFSSLKEVERLMSFDDSVAMEARGTENGSANVNV